MCRAERANDEARHEGEGLRGRIGAARRALETCELCERRCRVDRLAGQIGFCGLGSETRCFKRYVSYTEEMELVPALRVYLAGCSMRCRFCNTAPDGYGDGAGDPVEPTRLAAELAEAVRDGVKTVNLLGGEPSLHPHTILQLAEAAIQPLPLVLDTNAYASLEALRLLDGVIVTWLVDFKFGNDACAMRLADTPRYMPVVTRNIEFLAATGTPLIRHLLIPGHVDCCFKPLTDWLSKHLAGASFHLLTSYVPAWRAESDPQIGRLNARSELRSAIRHLEGLRLNWSVDGNARE